MKKISVPLSLNAYEIFVGENIFEKLSSLFENLSLSKNIYAVIDKNVLGLHREKILKEFEKIGGKFNYYSLEATEQNKSFETVQNIFADMLEKRCGRDTIMVAIGGGITGDITGYAAATYMRGIKYVQIPTTLLSAVDSSVGGKTGINFSGIKNIIGAFHQPEFVLIDTRFLATLPKSETVSGLGEVIKYAYLADKELFDYLNENLSNILNDGISFFDKLIEESVKFKSNVVVMDEKESGPRKMLNLGHTFAHAFEAEKSNRIKHGQAVIVGIVCALYLSEITGFIDSETLTKMLEPIEKIKSELNVNNVDFENFYSAMQRDKKNRENKIKFVLLNGIGEILLDVETSQSSIGEAVKKGIRFFE